MGIISETQRQTQREIKLTLNFAGLLITVHLVKTTSGIAGTLRKWQIYPVPIHNAETYQTIPELLSKLELIFR